MILGRSQRAVIEFMKIDPQKALTTQEVGDALYEKNSECFVGGHYGMGGKATPGEIRRSWAAKLLNGLKKKGLVERDGILAKKVWYLTEEGKNAA